MKKKRILDNGEKLRKLIEGAKLTQQEALALVNEGQAFPISMSAWKSYLSDVSASRRRSCSDAVLNRASEVIGPSKV